MSRRSTRHRLLALALASLAGALPLGAQGPSRVRATIGRADSLFRAGRVADAEALYYYAVRQRPRDPAARLALGRYLSARGAWRVGAVLMEEARFFGGDARTIGIYLAPVYARLGDFKALATLPGSPLPYPQRARAEWLRDNAPAVSGPDSATVPWRPAESGATLGTIELLVGRDTVRAAITPSEQGLVLDSGWTHRRSEVRVFASTYDTDWRNHAGVALTVGLGAMRLSNVPARFEALGGAGSARVGLDVLAALVPTFDPATRTLLLRTGDHWPDDAPGEHIPTLTYPGGVWLVRRDGVWPLTSEGGRAALGNGPWTLVAKRGELVVAGQE